MGKEHMTEGQEKLTTLQKLLQNEALVEAAPSVDGLNPDTVTTPGGSIYYGTGLSTSKELSIALPFDVLSMVLVAEKIRRATGMDTIYHFIADTHAKSNKLFPDEVVDQRAKETKEQLERMFANLGLDHFQIIFASDFDKTPEYQEIYDGFDTDKHDYVKREVADIEWLRKFKDLKLKVGWIIQSSETNLGSDERVFDREYKDKMGNNISFVYLKPGRTFDKSRPKASPYIHIPTETRLLLSKNEDVKAKLEAATQVWGDKHLGGARGYFIDIIRAYEKLIGPLGNIPIEEKIQAVIDKATA
jgi:hypothetical protein